VVARSIALEADITDGALRAPVKAGLTVFAFRGKDGLPVVQDNRPGGAEPDAKSAAVAFRAVFLAFYKERFPQPEQS
jgi:hypothetical protein